MINVCIHLVYKLFQTYPSHSKGASKGRVVSLHLHDIYMYIIMKIQTISSPRVYLVYYNYYYFFASKQERVLHVVAYYLYGLGICHQRP